MAAGLGLMQLIKIGSTGHGLIFDRLLVDQGESVNYKTMLQLFSHYIFF